MNVTHEIESARCRGQVFHHFVLEWGLVQDVESSKGQKGGLPMVPRGSQGPGRPRG